MYVYNIYIYTYIRYMYTYYIYYRSEYMFVCVCVRIFKTRALNSRVFSVMERKGDKLT